MGISPYQISWTILCFFILSETVTSGVSNVKFGINTRHDLRRVLGHKGLHKEHSTPHVKLQQRTLYDNTALVTISINNIINNVTKRGEPPDNVDSLTNKIKKSKNIAVEPSINKIDKTTNIGNSPEIAVVIRNECTDEIKSSLNNTTMTRKDDKTLSVDQEMKDIGNTMKDNIKDIDKDRGETKRLRKVSWLQGIPMKKENNNKGNNNMDIMGELEHDNGKNGIRKQSNNETDLLNDIGDAIQDSSYENPNALINNEICMKGLNPTTSNNVENINDISDVRDNLNETNSLRRHEDEGSSTVTQLNDSNMDKTVSTNVNYIDTTDNLMKTEKDLKHDYVDIPTNPNEIAIDSDDKNDTGKIKVETNIESKHSIDLATINDEKISTESGIEIREDIKQIIDSDQEIGYKNTNINDNIEGSQKVVETEEVNVHMNTNRNDNIEASNTPSETTAKETTPTADTVSTDSNNHASKTPEESKPREEAELAECETSRTDTNTQTTTPASQESSIIYLNSKSSKDQLNEMLENVSKNQESAIVSTEVTELKSASEVGPKKTNKMIENSSSYIGSEDHKSRQSNSSIYKYSNPYSRTLLGYLYRRLLASTTELTTLATTIITTTDKPLGQRARPKRPTVILNFAYKKSSLGYIKNIQNMMTTVDNVHNRAPKSKYTAFMDTDKRNNEKTHPETSYSGGSSLKKVRNGGKNDKKFGKLNRFMTNFETILGNNNNTENQTKLNSTSEKKGDATDLDLWKQIEDTIIPNDLGIKNATPSISQNGKEVIPKTEKDLDQTLIDLFNMAYLDDELSQPEQHQQNGSNTNTVTTPMNEVLRELMALNRPIGDSNYLDIAEQTSSNTRLSDKKNFLTKRTQINSQVIIANTTADIFGKTISKTKENPEKAKENELGREFNILNVTTTVDKEIPGNNEQGPQFADEYAKQLAAYPKYTFFFGNERRTTKVIDNRKMVETNPKQGSEKNSYNTSRTVFTNRTWNTDTKPELGSELTNLGYERGHQSQPQAKDLVQRLVMNSYTKFKSRGMTQKKGRLVFNNTNSKTHPPPTSERESFGRLLLPSLTNSRLGNINNPDPDDYLEYSSDTVIVDETTPLVALLYKPRGKKIENCTSENEIGYNREGGMERMNTTEASSGSEKNDGSSWNFRAVGDTLYAALGELIKTPTHVLNLTEKLVKLF